MVTTQFFSMSFVKFPQKNYKYCTSPTINRLQHNDKEYKIIMFKTKVDLKFVEAEKIFSPQKNPHASHVSYTVCLFLNSLFPFHKAF